MAHCSSYTTSLESMCGASLEPHNCYFGRLGKGWICLDVPMNTMPLYDGASMMLLYPPPPRDMYSNPMGAISPLK